MEILQDLSIHVIPGRVTDPTLGIKEAQEAEKLGLKRVWLPERYSNKEFGVTLSAIAANTERIGIGTGPMTLGSRAPLVTAAIGATLNSFYPSRFTLGVGRGDPAWAGAHAMPALRYPEMADWCSTIKRLWQGERVEYTGPYGTAPGLRLDDRPDAAIPKITMFHFGGPLASKAAANPVFDEVGFSPLLKPDVMRESIQQTRAECERIGRDPDEIHFIAPVASAPDLGEEAVLDLLAARLVIYLQVPQVGDSFVNRNGWDPKIREEICGHKLFKDMQSSLADGSFHRHQLLEVARLVPEEWLREAAVMGTIDECVAKLQEYKDTGCAEIDFYSSSPSQNAKLIESWRSHTVARTGAAA